MARSEEQPQAPGWRAALGAADRAPRCGARRKCDGRPCQGPAMVNGRCRLHGGRSPGPPRGNRNALKHGYYTAEAIAERRGLRALLRRTRELMSGLR